jgi:hypothetical protein
LISSAGRAAIMSASNECKKNITVKIHLPDDTENVLAVNLPYNFNVANMKDDIAKKFRINSEILMVYQNNVEISNESLLHDLYLNDFGIVEIKLKLSEHAVIDGVELNPSIYYSNFTLPDIITVHVPIEDENGEMTTKDLIVEIENKSIKKPFLGGLINKKTSELDKDI